MSEYGPSKMMMTPEEYRAEVKRTAAGQKTPFEQLAVFGLGLAGEAGEVADLIKKHLGHGHELDRTKMVKELGDVRWYLEALADSLGIEPGEIERANVEKLRARYPSGFTTAASKARVDVAEELGAANSPDLGCEELGHEPTGGICAYCQVVLP